ncbi:PREDICTED: uncharacterized protein LOC108612441 [Drosophila arizonae]|uniref:Uncharacterized protein LOC108612441 n=1 Tax=Drosophila arizonae TaxID=7263 RepID=A0ABM1P0S6_DROAR|nr:PREDICTED: uncharacterized protein LOC108612441 [Drosophila arizonae]
MHAGWSPQLGALLSSAPPAARRAHGHWTLRTGEGGEGALANGTVFTTFECKYVSSYEARISQDQLKMNTTLDLIQAITVDVWAKVSVGQREAKNGYRNIFSYNVNICSLIGKGKGMGIFQIWVQNILKYSNMPRACPIAEGHYYWRNLRPDRDSIPAFLMTGNFRIDVLFYMRDWSNDMLTNTTVFVDIKMK